MRKLVVSNLMSLDGYYDGPGGDFMVMPLDETFDAYNAERLRAADKAIAELKRGDGREILVFGSRTLWNDLLANGLVDELHLMVGAGVVGGGTPIFGTRPPGRLRLAEVRRFDGSDNLVLRYEVAGSGNG